MTQFSIITPVLNAEPFIARAAESVLRQASVDFEYLIQDGVSNDGTLERLDDFKGRCHISSEPDTGPAEAINRGIESSTGEWIGWLNADDAYTERALEQVTRFFQGPRTCDIAFGGTYHVDEADAVLEYEGPRRFRARRLRRRNTIPKVGVFVRRRVFDDLGLLDNRFRYWYEYDFWMRAAAKGVRFGSINEPLAFRRIHPGNSRSGHLSTDTKWRIARERLEMFAANHGPPPTRLVWDYANECARLAGYDPEIDTRFDRAVWDAAEEAEREFLDPGQLTSARRRALLATHLQRTVSLLLRRPHEVARLVPKAFREVVHVHARRRVFRLKHHAPRTVRLEAPPPRVFAAITPRVSIVTPNYNGAGFLEATMKSVVEQDYPDLEYIVQDGGSSDGSQALALQHASRLASFRSQPDRGQAQAINRGFSRSTGEVMGWLNSDDLLLPGTLRIVTSFFERRPDVDVVYGNRLLVDEDGREIGRWVLPPHDHELIAWADYIPQETMFWRRRAWEAVGGCLDESFQFAMDWDLILRFREAGMRFHRIPRFLGAFRVTDAQKTIQLIHTVGAREMKQLRIRHLGRNPSGREVRKKLRPFLRRHWIHDKVQVARERLANTRFQEVSFEHSPRLAIRRAA